MQNGLEQIYPQFLNSSIWRILQPYIAAARTTTDYLNQSSIASQSIEENANIVVRNNNLKILARKFLTPDSAQAYRDMLRALQASFEQYERTNNHTASSMTTEQLTTLMSGNPTIEQALQKLKALKSERYFCTNLGAISL